jgi:glycosyltransferase involved in cell wall biosynthesis
VTDRPRVSIGIPVYNGGDLFRETLESFLSQTFADFELLIGDNASTDQTETVAREYAALDPRIRYFRNPENIGLSGNYNRLFGLATGEYFKWAPADDLCCPTYIERCVEVLDRDPDVVLTYPKTHFIDANRQVLDIVDPGWHLMSDSPAERFRYVIYHGHWANSIIGLIRRSALEKTRLLPNYPGSDFRLLGELSLLGKFYEVPEYLFIRRLHERSSSQHTTDITWQAAYWSRGEKLPWPFLQLKGDHLLSIIHSQLGTTEKVSLVASLLRSIIGGRRTFFHEIRMHLTYFFAGLTRTDAPRHS